MKAIYVDAHSDGGRPAQRPVSAVMSSPVASVEVSASLDDALRRMVTAKVRHLAVVDATGAYAGIISDREIGAAWSADPECLTAQPVSALVRAGQVTVGAATPIVAAARVMRAGATDAVAVLDPDGAIVGIVTGTDLIAHLARYPA